MAIEYNDSTITYNANYVTYTGSITRSISISDVVGLTDSVLKVSNFVVSVVDNFGMTDSLVRTTTYRVALIDDNGLTDNIAIEQVIRKYVSDTLGLSDNINISRIIRTSESDSLGITDINERTLDSYRAIVESEGLSESISINTIRYREVQDSVSITDFINQFNREKDKNITAIFEIKDYKPHFIGVFSGITTSDLITTDTTYSANDVTYNDLTEVYSGVIMSTAPGKTPSFVRDVKPNNLSIGEKI